MQWDDFRVLEAFRFTTDEPSRAIRDRATLYGLVAEFNAENDLSAFETCERALRDAYGDAVWSDPQEQLMHRLPLVLDGRAQTVFVRTRFETIDAREASDLIARITGTAYWRKLFVERARVDVEKARLICRAATADRSLQLFETPAR